jgi:hypothetical protein
MSLRLLLAPFLVVAPVLWPGPARGSDSQQNLSRTNPLWKPVPDEVYFQEIGRQIPTARPVTALAVLGHTLYAVTGGALHRLAGAALQAGPEAPRNISRLRSLQGALWAATPQGVFRFADDKWERIDKRQFTDFCVHLGEVCGATRDEVFRFESGHFVSLRPPAGYLSSDTTFMKEDFSQVLPDPVQIGPIERIASYSGTLYLLRPGSLGLLQGATFVPDPIDWGALPSPRTRDMVVQGSRLCIATDRGVAVLRGMAMTALRGKNGLPYEDTTCLARGFEGDLWIGTSAGAIRQTGKQYHYFGAHHWLPAEYVRDIAVGEHTVYIATDGGLGIIRYEPFTLARKAGWFERALEEWGMKRLGFVHKLYWGGDQQGWLREISDNDGGNTAHYLAAMTFKYAATGDPQALHEARDAFHAMLWLGRITSKPGLVARAIWSVKGDKGERSTRGSGGLPAKWYPTKDGLWLWKGDTSSDEVNAHMYAVSLFYELAADPSEKQLAARHLAAIASYIMQNGWVLRDADGQPTRWGRWDPEYLLRPYGSDSRGLNGMEAQTYMQTAYALTGDAKFRRGLEQLLSWHYQDYTVRQRLTFPPDQVAPWDDELAFFCYHPLLRYTTQPELRSLYLRSLERTWEILRRHHLPFFNFSYGALTGNDCEAPQAVQHLREWSLDLINYSYRNSQRSDLAVQPGYEPYSGPHRVISPRESEAKWGDRSPLQYDGGEDGKAVTPPVGWLEDYWMGRYYGFIEPSRQGTPGPESVPARVLNQAGAAPYAGPPRPVGPGEDNP